MAKPSIVHLSITRPSAFGGIKTTSLCGRLRTTGDGMNLTADRAEVNCKFCLKKLLARPHRPADATEVQRG